MVTRKSIWVWTVVGLMAASAGEHFAVGAEAAAAQSPSIGPIRAGASVVDTTPSQFPVSLVGSFTDRKATSAHDPLKARCLVLDDGKQRIAIAVVDICILPREVCDKARVLASKATGIRPDRILIAATHTHSAPPTMVLNDIPLDSAYPNMLAQKISEAVKLAAGRLAPVKLGWGVAPVPAEVFNRRWIDQSDCFGNGGSLAPT